MQREGETEQRNATGASRRDPPIIEAAATEIGAPSTSDSPSPLDPVSVDSAAESPAPSEDAPDQTTPLPPKRRRSGLLLTVLGIPVIVVAGGVAWIATHGTRVPPDLRARIVAYLPEGAQKALGLAHKAGTPEPAETRAASSAPESKPTVSDAPGSAAPSPQPSNQINSAAPESSKTETHGEAQRAPAAAPAAVPPSAEATTPAATNSASIAPSADKTAPSENSADAGLGARMDAMNARLDALAAPSAAQAALAAKTDDLAAKLDKLAERIGGLEAKLTPPKSDQRAPEARENGEAAAGQSAAARVVVAQGLVQALVSGAPIGENVAALRALGMADDKLADFTPYLKAGAPSIAQLSSQWAALRGKIVVADRPAPDATWSDRLLARMRGIVQVNWAGQRNDASAFGIFSRVETALQRGDVAGAVTASDMLPGDAKPAIAEWRAAAMQRLNAENAAHAILSDSTAAIARPKS